MRERVAHEGKLCADHDYEYEHEHVVKWASTSELVSKLGEGVCCFSWRRRREHSSSNKKNMYAERNGVTAFVTGGGNCDLCFLRGGGIKGTDGRTVLSIGFQKAKQLLLGL